MAFHADAQAAARAACVLRQAFLGERELRQDALRRRQQVAPGLRQAQAAAFAQPDGGAQLLLELAHAVAQRRLRQTQLLGGGGERALAFNLGHDGEMDALQHIDE